LRERVSDGSDRRILIINQRRITALAVPTTTFVAGAAFSIQISASTRSPSSHSVVPVTRPRHVMRSPCCTPPFMNVSEMRLPLIQWGYLRGQRPWCSFSPLYPEQNI
jgi:mRNA-degrading endonuclease toxin of MazEF toxin-antitoxin module